MPADMGSSAVGEAAGARLELDADFSALVEDCWELRATAPAAGMLLLLLLAIVSPALLALSSLLCCQILLQQGPQGKGAVNDFMVIALAVEAPACCGLGCCGI